MIENLRARLDYHQILETKKAFRPNESLGISRKMNMSKRSRSTSVKFMRSIAKKFETDDAFDKEASKIEGEMSPSLAEERIEGMNASNNMTSGEPTYTEILEDEHREALSKNIDQLHQRVIKKDKDLNCTGNLTTQQDSISVPAR